MNSTIAASPPLERPLTARAHWLLRAPVAVLKYAIGVLLTAGAVGVFSPILVIGWTYRLVQRQVLRHWMDQHESTPDHGSRALVSWPNWILPQDWNRIRESQRSRWKKALYFCSHSLWVNLRLGAQGILSTSVFIFPAGILWHFGWMFGWDNSFHKGYEQAAIGPSLWWLGTLVFVIAMFHVPFAQAHQAVTGDWRSFFHVRRIRQLARQRPITIAGLAVLYAGAGLFVFVLLTLPTLVATSPEFDGMTDAQLAGVYGLYLLLVAAVGFPLVVLLRLAAGAIYARAMLDGVRTGELSNDGLCRIAGGGSIDLSTLIPEQTDRPLGWVRRSSRSLKRLMAGTTLVVAFSIVAMLGAVETFFAAKGGGTWLNRPLVQAPFFAAMPEALKKGD